jgi:hypothetical protein
MSKPSDKKPKGFLQSTYNFFAKAADKFDQFGYTLQENWTDPPQSKHRSRPLPPVLDVVIPTLYVAFVGIPAIAGEVALNVAFSAVKPVPGGLRDATKKIAKAVKRPVTEYQPPHN